MLARILIITGLASAGLLFVIVTTISPADGGATAILAVFLLSYLCILTIMTFALWLASSVIARLGSGLRFGRGYQSLSLRKSYYYSTVIALGPVITTSLQSVGEVGIYELGLIIVFILLGCVYVAKRAG